MEMTIGIVTVLYNSDDVLSAFFESLSRQVDIKYRLYVIDNSAADSGSRLSRRLAEEYDVDAEIVFNNANLGVAKGNNQGIEMARADGCSYILLSNNDIEFSNPRLLANLLKRLCDEKVAAVVPKIYFYGFNQKIWYAGGAFSVLRATAPHFGEGEDDRGQYDEIRCTDYAPTCLLLVATSVFEQIGVMDERFFVYYDDTDFLWRMKKAELKVGFVPDENVLHKVSYSTGGAESEFSLFYGTRNRLYFIRKHYAPALAAMAIGYVLTTRVLKSSRLNRNQRKSMWRGVREGLRLAVQ